MDIAAWLRELGLERYQQAFQENEIDADLLPKLTADDLKELGVSLVGHRRRLLDEIALLPETEASSGRMRSVEPPRSGAERRQLTVMFVDLVGSTALSARLDPEDMGAVIRAYQECCTGVVERWDGHVAKYMGDGVVVYFGYPQAHEDDAERAVRAGLGLTEAIAHLRTADGTALAARVGIATGLVMVGELIGEGAAQEEAVVGETPNLAARLEALAEAGSVVIAPGTRYLLGGLFDLADRGGHALKGFTEPVRAWQVIGQSLAEGRFEALRGEQLTPLVGREHELALLLDRWQLAEGGEGQVVLLSGEPGIGKSRITQALRERVAGEPHTRLSYYCSPHHINSALHPVIGQLERAAGFLPDDSADARLDRLEALLVQASAWVAEVAPLLAAFLSIPTDGRYPPVSLTPQMQKARIFEALVEQLQGLAARQPVLMVFEDAHWIDPTSAELLGLVIDRLQRLPVMLLITFRPEFSTPWTGHAHVTSLSLNRLGRHQGMAMALRVAGKDLPDDVLDQILAKTDGVPLFVEELTKTILESGLLTDAGDHYARTGPLSSLGIPTTLQDSLMARLDRLAPAKQVAQIGAAIGREFSHELLVAVTPLAEDKLASFLDQLIASELIFRRGTSPQVTYGFKHALVQDVAYQSLLKSKREQLHAQIAKALEERFEEKAETEPELLAHHYSGAGLVAEAIHYWLEAGKRATERSAYAEAFAHLDTGLQLLGELPATRERTGRALQLQTARASALIATKGYGAPEGAEAYTRARELCRELGDPPEVFPVLRGLHVIHLNRAEYNAGLEVAQECLRLAQDQEDTAPLLLAHRAMGMHLLYMGKLTAARKHLVQVSELYDPQRHSASTSIYGLDPKSGSMPFLSKTLCLLGYPDRALAVAQEALNHAQQLGYALGVAIATNLAGETRELRGDYQAALDLAEQQLALANEHGLLAHVGYARQRRSVAQLGLGEISEGAIAELREATNALRTEGQIANLPGILGGLARALAAAGQLAEAVSVIAEALAVTKQTAERWSEAELRRLNGELLLAQDDASAAEACFRQALDIAHHQRAKLWELRVATSLARLWRDQGKRAEARDLLAPVYAWFTEGFDTADLKDAKGLLDELR